MILRMPSPRNCSNPLATDSGSLHFRSCAARATSREAAPKCSLSLVPRKGVTESPRLFAEDENTSLAGKADFPYLPVLSKQQGIIGGLGAAVFPAAFGFGNHLLAFLHGGLVPVDLQTVFTGLQLGLAEFGGLHNVDGLGEGFCKSRDCQCDGGQQSHAADKSIRFHACQFPFKQVRVSRTAGCYWLEGVDTHEADEYSRP